MTGKPFKTPDRNGRAYLGFNIQQIIIVVICVLAIGGLTTFIGFQNYVIALVDTHAPYKADKQIISETLTRHEESIKQLKVSFHSIDKTLGVIVNNQKRIMRKIGD